MHNALVAQSLRFPLPLGKGSLRRDYYNCLAGMYLEPIDCSVLLQVHIHVHVKEHLACSSTTCLHEAISTLGSGLCVSYTLSHVVVSRPKGRLLQLHSRDHFTQIELDKWPFSSETD